jgi:hypothetical protein
MKNNFNNFIKKIQFMKTLMTIISVVIISFSVTAQTDIKKNSSKSQIVDASCGQCNFGLTDKKGCDLAVKIDGKAYWVTGTELDKHGDAHAADGFCSTVRKAKVTGEIVDGKFIASSFKLLPPEKKHDEHEGHNHN